MRTEEESTVLRQVGQFRTSEPEVVKVLTEILPEARQEHIRLRRGRVRRTRFGRNRFSRSTRR